MAETKPGCKTTEFWLTLAAIIVGAVASAGLFVEDSTPAKVVGVVGATLATLGYQGARSRAKAPK